MSEQSNISRRDILLGTGPPQRCCQPLPLAAKPSTANDRINLGIIGIGPRLYL